MNNQTASIGTLQKLNKEDFNYISDYILDNMDFRYDHYKSQILKSMTFSYDIKKGKAKENVTIESFKAKIEINYQENKNVNLPLTMNPLEYGIIN